MQNYKEEKIWNTSFFSNALYRAALKVKKDIKTSQREKLSSENILIIEGITAKRSPNDSFTSKMALYPPVVIVFVLMRRPIYQVKNECASFVTDTRELDVEKSHFFFICILMWDWKLK